MPSAGPSEASLALLRSAVADPEAVARYLAKTRLLGRRITRAGIIAALTVPGVENVELEAPAADVACTLTQVANATSITVTHAGFAS